ncbi:XRE family transcriptional regulator [Nocardia sp. NPDC052278]|uniref:XRE family transcriptional regulator n=1 Tax=unclassified Nocardia TaxID=2637762 RepID=UPI0036C1D040
MTSDQPRFVPSRLVFARKRRGMARTHLASALNVTERTVHRWETGTDEPARERWADLARELRVRPEFFTLDEVEPLPVGAVSFRALTKMSARERDRAITAGEQGVAIMRWIEQRFTLPANNVPTFTEWDPELAADTLRARWELGTGPIKNLLPVMELHGIRVFSIAADFRDVDAFSFYRSGTPFAFLDTSKTAERLRFDAAHELGHLCLHAEHGVPHGKDAETEANRFAAAFLMPRDSVFAAGLHNATATQIIRAKSRWHVSAIALTHRLHTLGLLTDWTHRSVCVELGQRGYRSAEPGSRLVPERSQVIGKVIAALRAQGMTIRDIATEFGLPPDGLTEYMFGLTMTPLAGTGQATGSPARPALAAVPSPH